MKLLKTISKINFKQLLNKAFIGGTWYVGYRKKENDKFTIMLENSKNWIADPFLFEYQNDHYLFVEYMQGKKGVIAYYKFIDGVPTFQKVIIDEPYHLSYPCIFKYNDNIFMIPESADHHTIDLYTAVEFPNKWEKSASLYNGICYDTTVFIDDNIISLFVYEVTKNGFLLKIFDLDIETKQLTLLSSKFFEQNKGRPAGGILKCDDKLFRVVQDCTIKYGEKIVFNKIDSYKEGNYSELFSGEIAASQIDNRFQRIHTFNQDSRYEVMDFYKEKVEITRPFSLVLKKMKQIM